MARLYSDDEVVCTVRWPSYFSFIPSSCQRHCEIEKMANENHRDGQGGGNGGSFLQHFYFFLTSVLKWRERERGTGFLFDFFFERERKKDWSMRRPSQAVASDVVLSVTKIAVLRMALVFLLISHPISPVLGGIQSSSTRSASAKSRGHLLPNSSVIYLEYIFFLLLSCCCCSKG